jgi:hypothetical protein
MDSFESLELKATKLDGLISVLEDYIREIGKEKHAPLEQLADIWGNESKYPLDCLFLLRKILAEDGLDIPSNLIDFRKEREKVREEQEKKEQEKKDKKKLRKKKFLEKRKLAKA